MLQWLIAGATGIDARPDHMVIIVQLLNFSSSVTTISVFYPHFLSNPQTLIHALYTLAIHPEYVEPLREEILEALSGDWTMAAIMKMRKLESFVKESMRMQPLTLCTTRFLNSSSNGPSGHRSNDFEEIYILKRRHGSRGHTYL